MTEPLRNYSDHGDATAVTAVQAPQWHRASGVTGILDCRVRSVRLATALMMSDGAISASTGRLLALVDFIHHVIILQVSFSVVASFFAWVERSHTEQAHSAAE